MKWFSNQIYIYLHILNINILKAKKIVLKLSIKYKKQTLHAFRIYCRRKQAYQWLTKEIGEILLKTIINQSKHYTSNTSFLNGEHFTDVHKGELHHWTKHLTKQQISQEPKTLNKGWSNQSTKNP